MRKLSQLLLFLCLAAALHAQDETFTIIQRNHYPADKFAQVVKNGEIISKLYSENGVSTPVTAWVFDDNTIEWVWEVNSTAESDQIGDEYAAARMRIGKERIDKLVIPTTDKEFWMGGDVDELSYVPEDVDLSEMNFINVMRIRIKTDDAEEFQRVAAGAVDLAKRNNSQLPFYVEMYPMGLGSRMFEVVEFGKDRADFERRKAAGKGYRSSKEYKAWEQERDRIAEVVSTRTATRNKAMSIRKPEDQPEPTSLLLVNEYTVGEGKMEAAMDYFDTYNKLATKYHYPQASHFASSSDQRTIMDFMNLTDYTELERVRAKNRQMNYVPDEEQEKVRRDNKGVFTDHEEYVLRYHPEQSYRSKTYQRADDQPNNWIMTVYEYPYGKGREAWQLLDDIKASYEAVSSEITYNILAPALGGPSNRIYVVTFGLDRDDLRRRLSEGNAALPTEKRTELQNRQEELFQVVRRITGVTHFDKQYTPRTAGM